MHGLLRTMNVNINIFKQLILEVIMNSINIPDQYSIQRFGHLLLVKKLYKFLMHKVVTLT